MRIGVLSYADVLPAGLLALRAAAGRAGDVELVEIEPHALQVVVSGRPRVQVAGADLDVDVDVVLHRTVYPYRHLVVPALEVLARNGCVVLNDPHAALLSRDKLRTLLALSVAGLPTVPTVGVADVPPAEHLSALQTAEVVLKPALGAQGRGVVRAPVSGLEGAQSWVYAATRGATLVQPLIPSPFDLRAFVVGEWCAVAQRRAGAGEWRCNLALGGTATAVHDPVLRHAAERLAVDAVRAIGLDYAAVDLLVDETGLLVSEVDAWGGFTGVEGAVQADVGFELIELARRRLCATKP